MSRNERDWNRRIPQRQAPQASPSRLLRSVANEHIPEPDPVAPLTGGWSTPNTMTTGNLTVDLSRSTAFSLGRSPGLSATYDYYLRPLFEQFDRDAFITVPRNQGRSLQGDFEGDRAEYLRDEVLREIRNQNPDPRDTHSTGWGRGGAGSGGGTTWTGNGGGGGVAPPLTQISRTADTIPYPISRTVEVNVGPQRRFMNFVVPGGMDIPPGRIQDLTERLRFQVEEETQRLLRVGLEDISMELMNEGNMANIGQMGHSGTLNGRVTRSIQSSNTITTNEILGMGSTLGRGNGNNQSALAEEIKAWIKSALEIRTELTEEDGSLSVKTIVLLDGEEVSSDSDFVTLHNPHLNDF